MYIVLGSFASRTFRVLWMLEEIGVPYEHQAEPPQSPVVRALNPSGKVPVLVVDGTVLTDSTAILTYLADRYGKLTYPAGTFERARQDGLTQCLLDELEALLWTAARHSFILPPEQRLPAIKDSLRWEFAVNSHRLAEGLGNGPFLMGETMTIADIIAGHCLTWAERARMDPLPPALAAYHARLCDRPAYQRVQEMAVAPAE